jgi:hypothetical protein
MNATANTKLTTECTITVYPLPSVLPYNINHETTGKTAKGLEEATVTA